MTGTGPTAALRNRLEATSAPTSEMASDCRLLMESDISDLLEPAPGPPRGHAKDIADGVPNAENGGKLPFPEPARLNARFTYAK